MNRRDGPGDTRRTRRAANLAALAVVAFAALSLSTTQIRAIRSVVPWADDPYDAVVSFAMLLLPLVVLVTLVRSVRYRGVREIPGAARRRIHRGAWLAVVAVLAGVASDTIALASGGMPAAPVAATVAVVALLAVTAIVGITATVLLRDAAHSAGPVAPTTTAPAATEPDAMDDTLALLLDASALLRNRARRASRVLDRAVAAGALFLERSRLSPRRHPMVAALIVALCGGLAAAGWHALVEGPWASPVAAAIFGGLAAAGILAALGGLSGYLRLVRTA